LQMVPGPQVPDVDGMAAQRCQLVLQNEWQEQQSPGKVHIPLYLERRKRKKVNLPLQVRSPNLRKIPLPLLQ
ncbi:unnamed protein product, partial [Bubo scandiacus]